MSQVLRMVSALAMALGMTAFVLPGVPARAQQSLSEGGLVVAVDASERTLTLVSGRVLHVPENAVIRGADGQRLALEGIRPAEPVGGGFAGHGESMVRYEAQRILDRYVAREIAVTGIAPQ
jgi:hypothetical protein